MYKHINIYVNKHENFKLLFNIKENNASYVLQKKKNVYFAIIIIIIKNNSLFLFYLK